MSDAAPQYNPYTHCSHGKPYLGHVECPQCELVWLKQQTLPELVARVRRVAYFVKGHPGIVPAALEKSIMQLNEATARMAAELESLP